MSQDHPVLMTIIYRSWSYRSSISMINIHSNQKKESNLFKSNIYLFISIHTHPHTPLSSSAAAAEAASLMHSTLIRSPVLPPLSLTSLAHLNDELAPGVRGLHRYPKHHILVDAQTGSLHVLRSIHSISSNHKSS